MSSVYQAGTIMDPIGTVGTALAAAVLGWGKAYLWGLRELTRRTGTRFYPES
jgi:hypothetical protein